MAGNHFATAYPVYYSGKHCCWIITEILYHNIPNTVDTVYQLAAALINTVIKLQNPPDLNCTCMLLFFGSSGRHAVLLTNRIMFKLNSTTASFNNFLILNVLIDPHEKTGSLQQQTTEAQKNTR